MQDCLLLDIPMQGHPFTWSGGRGTDDFNEERLDRMFATQDWFDLFPYNVLINGVASRSDHTPLWLQLWERRRRGTPRPFRFENSWLEEEGLADVVGESWARGVDGDFMRRMEDFSMVVDSWGKKLRSRYRLDINKCREELDLLRSSNYVEASGRYKEVNNRLSSLLSQEETFWRQRIGILAKGERY